MRAWLDHALSRGRAEGWGDLLFVPAALLILCAYLTMTSDVFLTERNVTNILVQGSVLACLAFGVTFVVLAGELDLSVGSGAALASVVSAFVMRDTGSFELGALAGIGAGAVIGTFNGIVVTQLQVPSFIVTLGTLVIARGIALALTDGSVVTGLPDGVGSLVENEFLGLPYVVWLVFAVVFGAAYFFQSQTSFGIRVLAVGGNREAARLSAVPVDRTRFLCFLISGVTMGIAGAILTARVESGQPNAADGFELFAVAAIVLGGTSLFGGRGSVARTLWGVLFITTLENGLDIESVGDDVKRVVIGVVLIAGASADFFRTRLRRRRTIGVGREDDASTWPDPLPASAASAETGRRPKNTPSGETHQSPKSSTEERR